MPQTDGGRLTHWLPLRRTWRSLLGTLLPASCRLVVIPWPVRIPTGAPARGLAVPGHRITPASHGGGTRPQSIEQGVVHSVGHALPGSHRSAWTRVHIGAQNRDDGG